MNTINDIKKNLEKEMDNATAFLAAWSAVTFPTKKDGKPFANMSKNINGAKYTLDAYAMQPGEYRLTVYTQNNLSGYIHDEICCYNLVKYLRDADKIKKTYNYMPKLSMLEQVYKYDIDDIKKAVADRIKYHEKRIQSLNEQLSRVEKAYNEFDAAYGKILDKLQEACNTNDISYSNGRNDLFYAIKDAVIKSHY